jgi:hypothetical protein
MRSVIVTTIVTGALGPNVERPVGDLLTVNDDRLQHPRRGRRARLPDRQPISIWKNGGNLEFAGRLRVALVGRFGGWLINRVTFTRTWDMSGADAVPSKTTRPVTAGNGASGIVTFMVCPCRTTSVDPKSIGDVVSDATRTE